MKALYTATSSPGASAGETAYQLSCSNGASITVIAMPITTVTMRVVDATGKQVRVPSGDSDAPLIVSGSGATVEAAVAAAVEALPDSAMTCSGAVMLAQATA